MPFAGKTVAYAEGVGGASEQGGCMSECPEPSRAHGGAFERFAANRGNDLLLWPSRDLRCCRCPSRGWTRTCATWLSAILCSSSTTTKEPFRSRSSRKRIPMCLTIPTLHPMSPGRVGRRLSQGMPEGSIWLGCATNAPRQRRSTATCACSLQECTSMKATGPFSTL